MGSCPLINSMIASAPGALDKHLEAQSQGVEVLFAPFYQRIPDCHRVAIRQKEHKEVGSPQ